LINFENIRPYHDDEVNNALNELRHHPMIKALLNFSFPDKSQEVIHEILDNCYSIRDFQTKVIYYSVKNVLERSSEGFTTGRFDRLDAKTPYFIYF
jgi:hypothetical protein